MSHPSDACTYLRRELELRRRHLVEHDLVEYDPTTLRVPQELADAAAVHAAATRVTPLLADVAAAPLDPTAVENLARWVNDDYPRAAGALLRLHEAGTPRVEPRGGAA
jgi:hypothetical protein